VTIQCDWVKHIALSVVIVAVATAIGTAPVHADDQPDTTHVYGQMDDDDDRVELTGTQAGGGPTNELTPESQQALVLTQVLLTPACTGNDPASSTTMCQGAITACQLSAPGSVLIWRWTRQWNRQTNVAQSEWGIADASCADPETADVPDVNLLVLRAFREQVKLLDAAIQIQPPSGRTLVNLDTIFYTDDPSTTVTGINILGRSVDLRITADAFHWYFGDGRTITTPTPGQPYPAKDVIHRYSTTGPVAPRVDVTYTGEYRIDGGGWLDIPGDATVTGAEAALTVVEARSELIAG
jgi:hypothetical protein